MTRVTFVKKARKDIPESGIKRGESYFWWKFRFSGKHVSKTKPRRSQLTESSKKAALYDAEDSVSDAIANVQAGKWGLPDLQHVVEHCVDSVRSVADEYRSSAENIESAFPNGSSKIDELLDRADIVEEIADSLETVLHKFPELQADAIHKDAMNCLPPRPHGSCLRCKRKRLVDMKQNRGYGGTWGGWHKTVRRPCPRCCRGMQVVVADMQEVQKTFKTDSRGRLRPDRKMVSYVWIKTPVESEVLKNPTKPTYQWEKLTPVDYVRRERAAGRIPPHVRTHAEQQAIDSIITEIESIQWNI